MKLMRKPSKESHRRYTHMINGGVLLQYVYLLFYWFYLSKTLIVIYLFKLLRLLHRIDPLLTERRKVDTTSAPPIGAPSWCLKKEALERYNRSNDNIPIYDQTDDESGHESNENGTNRTNSSKKKKENQKKN